MVHQHLNVSPGPTEETLHSESENLGTHENLGTAYLFVSNSRSPSETASYVSPA